jgi:hypothetical protein
VSQHRIAALSDPSRRCILYRFQASSAQIHNARAPAALLLPPAESALLLLLLCRLLLHPRPFAFYVCLLLLQRLLHLQELCR